MLVALGAEALADLLLRIARYDNGADDLIEQLISTPEENFAAIKLKLAQLKSGRRFVSEHEAQLFATQLGLFLGELGTCATDPRTGVELVVEFYWTEDSILDHCDDSDSSVRNVYRYEANEAFISFASMHPDKEWLSERVYELILKDEHHTRATLIDSASQYLSEPVIRGLIEKLRVAASEQTDSCSQYQIHIESLARQIKDAPLFEETRLARQPHRPEQVWQEIAKVYLECGDAQTARDWLEKKLEGQTICESERDQLWLEIYKRLGEREKEVTVAWRIFKRFRNTNALENLLKVIGQDQRAAVIKETVTEIQAEPELSHRHAEFLVEIGHLDEAETYLLNRAAQIDGGDYYSLPPLAEAMEQNGHYFCATLIYRALLDSLLDRAASKAYHYGADYLLNLQKIAEHISDWRGALSHKSYLKNLRAQHSRKRSFWSRFC